MPERVEEICENITTYQQTFACHKTTISGEEDREVTDDSQHCGGALILLEKIEQPNQMMRIMGRIGGYDPTLLHMNSPVFDTIDEMIEHYESQS